MPMIIGLSSRDKNQQRDLDYANEHEVNFGLGMTWICFHAWYMNDRDMQMSTLCKLGVYNGCFWRLWFLNTRLNQVFRDRCIQKRILPRLTVTTSQRDHSGELMGLAPWKFLLWRSKSLFLQPRDFRENKWFPFNPHLSEQICVFQYVYYSLFLV